MTEIELGDKVKCIYSGFEGIAVSKLEFMNGCIQYGILSKCEKDNKIPEELFIDSNSLKIIRKKAKPRIERDTGGPNHSSVKMRGY